MLVQNANKLPSGELTLQDWLAVWAMLCGGGAILLLILIGAYTVVRWLL